MKKLIVPGFTILLFGCSSTPTAKWDAAYASKACFDAATKGKYDLDDARVKKIHGICDCAGQKMVTTFKTEKEANEKMTDAAAFANDCKETWEKNQLSK